MEMVGSVIFLMDNINVNCKKDFLGFYILFFIKKEYYI